MELLHSQSQCIILSICIDCFMYKEPFMIDCLGVSVFKDINLLFPLYF